MCRESPTPNCPNAQAVEFAHLGENNLKQLFIQQLFGSLCPDHTCLSVAPGRVSQYTSDNSETGEMNIKNISQYQVNPIMSMSVLA